MVVNWKISGLKGGGVDYRNPDGRPTRKSLFKSMKQIVHFNLDGVWGDVTKKLARKWYIFGLKSRMSDMKL